MATEALAVDSDPDSEHVQAVLEDPRSQSIREAVGGFTVEDTAVTRTDDTTTPLVATEVQTDVGRLLHAEKGGRTEVKLDLADLQKDPSVRRRLPPEYRGVPADSNVSLIGLKSGVELVRTVTDGERRRLERALDREFGGKFEQFGAVYQSDIEGYGVTVETTAGEVKQFQVGRPVARSDVQELDPDPPIGGSSGEGASTQGSCFNTCLTCASAAASKGICYASCALVTTLAGAVLCAACVVTSSVGLISCAQCCDCAGC